MAGGAPVGQAVVAGDAPVGQPVVEGERPHDGWSHVLMWASFLGAVIAGISTAFLIVLHGKGSLIVATAILTGLILLYWVARKWWVKIAMRDAEELEAKGGVVVVDVFASAERAAQSMVTAGTLVVTVQGVVLGLVFAFNNGATSSVTVKVGIGSLAFGVSMGLLLVSLCAFSLPGRRTQVVAALLFNLSIWNLSYGLVCIASEAIGS
ncbi:hypothetical protein OG607_42030 [Streptomyces sp. NBC_01537]|uniref:hypothetical protein n=1 Tax=Streptomyces sp. NBC_01537 TaxID=2903896 RepID=UPI0038701CBA